MLASSLREEAQATVSNKPGHRGDHEVRRKTIARGCRVISGEPVVTTLGCLFLSAPRLRVHRAPGIPCALCFIGRNFFAKPRAYRAARMRTLGLEIGATSLRGAKRRSNPFFVIPGCATWRTPGIHTHDRGYGFRARSLRSRPQRQALRACAGNDGR